MGFFEVTSRFLSITPRVWADEGVLRIRTSLLGQLLTAGFGCRDVAIDPRGGRIDVRRRSWWLVRRDMEIPFSRVHYVDTEFSSLATSWNLYGRTDQVESFTVRLVLRDPPEDVVVARMVGEGSRSTGWTGVLLGDGIFDVRGAQEQANRQLVELLATTLGVSVGRPIEHVADREGRKRFCQTCDRPSPPNRTKCQYCGGPVVARP